MPLLVRKLKQNEGEIQTCNFTLEMMLHSFIPTTVPFSGSVNYSFKKNIKKTFSREFLKHKKKQSFLILTKSSHPSQCPREMGPLHVI